MPSIRHTARIDANQSGLAEPSQLLSSIDLGILSPDLAV
jgi:hypothetical protein